MRGQKRLNETSGDAQPPRERDTDPRRIEKLKRHALKQGILYRTLLLAGNLPAWTFWRRNHELL
jgi:hypothetical protein